MPDSTSSIIVAMTPHRVIGRDGQLPWHLSADLQRFKKLTMGHHIIMGRKTYDSIGRLLPGRTSVVVTRRRDLVIPGAKVVHSVDAAVAASRGDAEMFFVGGQEIYREALRVADRIYLTVVADDRPGDAHFPPIPPEQWQLVQEEPHKADARNEFNYCFQLWERRL